MSAFPALNDNYMFFLLFLKFTDELLRAIINAIHGFVDNKLIFLTKLYLIFLDNIKSTISLVMFCVRPCSLSKKLERVVR